MRRLVLLFAALGLSLATFAAPASAAVRSPLTLTLRNRQGHVLASVHPGSFHLVDADGHPLPEGQLVADTRAGALVLTIPSTAPLEVGTFGRSLVSATLRVQETTPDSVKVKLNKPFISAIEILPGKTRLTIVFTSMTLSFCNRLVTGQVTCH